MSWFDVEYINDFDLDGWRLEQELNAASDPVAQVNLWFLNVIQRYEVLVQKDLVFHNKLGHCPVTCIYDSVSELQVTISLHVRVINNVIQATKIIYPLFNESQHVTLPIAEVASILDTGDLSVLRQYLLDSTVEPTIVDKQALALALQQASILDSEEYTPLSWDTLVSAVTIGEAVFINVYATQLQVDSATSTINNAINSLINRADKSALIETLITASSITDIGYTPESWDDFINTLTSANIVNNDLNALQSTVDAINNALLIAIENLTIAVDKSLLNNAINSINNYNASIYTSESWDTFSDAVDAGILIRNDNNATQSAVDLATDNIVNARNNLELDPNVIPEPLMVSRTQEASYRDIARSGVDITTINDNESMIYAIGGKSESQGMLTSFALEQKDDTETFIRSNDIMLVPYAYTQSIIPRTNNDVTITMVNGNNLDNVIIGSSVLINDEVFMLVSCDMRDLSVTLSRGCVDSVPEEHPVGSLILFCADNKAMNSIVVPTNTDIETRLITKTAFLELDPNIATVENTTTIGLHSLPYPPANFKINHLDYPTEVSNGLSITFANRNKVLQYDTLVPTTVSGITLESSVSTEIDILDKNNVLLHSVNIGTSENYNYTSAMSFNDGLQPELIIVARTIKDTKQSKKEQHVRVTRQGLGFSLGQRLGGVARV